VHSTQLSFTFLKFPPILQEVRETSGFASIKHKSRTKLIPVASKTLKDVKVKDITTQSKEAIKDYKK